MQVDGTPMSAQYWSDSSHSTCRDKLKLPIDGLEMKLNENNESFMLSIRARMLPGREVTKMPISRYSWNWLSIAHIFCGE